MDKRPVLQTFNQQFESFIADVLAVFPENEDLQFTQVAIKTIRKANPRMLIATWKESVTDIYGDEIENGNKDFFLNKDYGQDLEGNESASKIMESIDRLRAPIREMGADNQNKAMQYVQNLTKLSRLYYS
tara:strand:- start:20 stop:409 length:390 start_codon:yes stop_codon:yes gene_type:complete